jgi:hypothetical protein
MATLKSLSFVTLPKVDNTDPKVLRRAEIVKRLTDQKLLALDPAHVKVTKGKSGEKAQKVRPSWVTLPDGQIAFFLKVGFQPMEWSPGKTAVAVPSLDKLPETIDVIIAAVQSGSLDAKLMGGRTAIRGAETLHAARIRLFICLAAI